MTDKSVGLENAGLENGGQKVQGGLKRTDKIKTYVIYFVS